MFGRGFGLGFRRCVGRLSFVPMSRWMRRGRFATGMAVVGSATFGRGRAGQGRRSGMEGAQGQ